jgi:hypothetical protein
LHVLLIGQGGLPLELIQVGAHAFHTGAGDFCVIFERSRQQLRFGANLLFEVGNLRPQLLDARMAREQRRRLLGQLRPQGDPLFRQPADQFRIHRLRRLDRPARLQRLADQTRPHFGVGFLRARGSQLGIELRQLLRRQRRVVGADKQIGF